MVADESLDREASDIATEIVATVIGSEQLRHACASEGEPLRAKDRVAILAPIVVVVGGSVDRTGSDDAVIETIKVDAVRDGVIAPVAESESAVGGRHLRNADARVLVRRHRKILKGEGSRCQR